MRDRILFLHNTSKSGLGDRLIDLCCYATVAHFKDAELHLIWNEIQLNYESKKIYWHYKENENKFFDEVRYYDYKVEILTKYFDLPKNIFIKKNAKPNQFVENIGQPPRVITPFYVWETYCPDIPESIFINKFLEICHEFIPKSTILSYQNDIPTPNLTIHLRRKDKIRLTDIGGYAIDYRDEKHLNDLTHKVLEDALQKKPNLLLYFSSDDLQEKQKWESKYSTNVLKTPVFTYDYENTYYDLYMMSISDNILLSNIYSSFSIFASLINQKNLIYLYKESHVEGNGYTKMKNFYYYTDWLNEVL